MGDDGAPHGVSGLRVATCVKSANDWRPVPPMTAMPTGSLPHVSLMAANGPYQTDLSRSVLRSPSCGSRCVFVFE